MTKTIQPECIESFSKLEDLLQGLNFDHGESSAMVLTRHGRIHLAFCTDPDGAWFLETGDPRDHFTPDRGDGDTTYQPLPLAHISEDGPYFVVRDEQANFSPEEPTLVVHELGEEGDSWVVSGTTAETHPEVINRAIAKWVIDTCGISDGTAIDVIERLAQDPDHLFRADWAYVPVNDEHPDDECYLEHGDEAAEHLPRFAGTLVTA